MAEIERKTYIISSHIFSLLLLLRLTLGFGQFNLILRNSFALFVRAFRILQVLAADVAA